MKIEGHVNENSKLSHSIRFFSFCVLMNDVKGRFFLIRKVGRHEKTSIFTLTLFDQRKSCKIYALFYIDSHIQLIFNENKYQTFVLYVVCKKVYHQKRANINQLDNMQILQSYNRKHI